MLEFMLSYNDGQCVECLAVNNPRVVDLTRGIDSNKIKLMREHDYCVILNNQTVGSFKTGMKLNNADIVLSALRLIEESIERQRDTFQPLLDLFKEIQDAHNIPTDPKAVN